MDTELKRASSHVQIPEDVYLRYKSALDTGVAILTTPDNVLYAQYRELDRLSYLLDRMRTADDVYWATLAKMLQHPKHKTLEDASKRFTGLALSLRSRSFEDVRVHMTGLRQMGILSHLKSGKKVFDSGHDHVNNVITRERARANSQRQIQYSRQFGSAALAQVVNQATRSHLTTPEYRIAKTTVRPLPGSYASRQ